MSVSLTQTAGMHRELERDLGSKEGTRAKTSPLGSKLLVKAQQPLQLLRSNMEEMTV